MAMGFVKREQETGNGCMGVRLERIAQVCPNRNVPRSLFPVPRLLSIRA